MSLRVLKKSVQLAAAILLILAMSGLLVLLACTTCQVQQTFQKPVQGIHLA